MSEEQDTGKFRQNTKDQFYTKPSIARECINSILSNYPEALQCIWVEPSAGNGAFLSALPSTISRVAIDLDPRVPGIIKADFLTWIPASHEPRVFFGNPPFGSQGSLAKSFIKHAAQNTAKVIAFILPRSFMKPSMTSAFPLNFHLIHQRELPKDSFEVNGEAYDVPCIFQIWINRDVNRVLDEKREPVGFKYVKATDTYHMTFRRVGVNAGKCYLKDVGKEKSPQSHYFLAFDEKYAANLSHIKDAINNHTFPSNTVGPRSLSKGEANKVINDILSLI